MEMYEQNTVRLVLCDPNQDYMNDIVVLLGGMQMFIHPIRCFLSTFALESYLTDTLRGHADIIILSADFPEDAGILAARRLWEMYPHLLILFSASDIGAAAGRLFTMTRPYSPFGLLSRPVDPEQIRLNLEQAAAQMKMMAPHCFLLKTSFGLASVRFSRVVFAESDKRIIHVYLSNGMQYDTYMKMDILETAMPKHFMRVHQSYLVNLDYAQMLCDNLLTLTDGRSVPVSRNYKNQLKEQLFLLKGFC